MTQNTGTLDQQIAAIQKRIDWLAETGFDFLSTENGYSEFTHPDDIR